MPTGTVKWFNSTKGFGFIAPDDGGKDVFVHISAVERAGLQGLNDNQKIGYELQSGRDGRASAGDLRLLYAGAPGREGGFGRRVPAQVPAIGLDDGPFHHGGLGLDLILWVRGFQEIAEGAVGCGLGVHGAGAEFHDDFVDFGVGQGIAADVAEGDLFSGGLKGFDGAFAGVAGGDAVENHVAPWSG